MPSDRYIVHGLDRERTSLMQKGVAGGQQRAISAVRDRGRFVREAPANAGDGGPADAGPAHQPLNATQRNTTQRGSEEPETTKRKNGKDEGVSPKVLASMTPEQRAVYDRLMGGRP